MRVQLLYPNRCQHPKEISLGLATISGVLKRAGHDVALIDTTFGMADREVVARVEEFAPDLIAASCLSGSYPFMAHLAGLLRQRFDTPVLVGGVHATVAPEDAISVQGVDHICVGEGEEAILELLESMRRRDGRTDIANIWFKDGDRVIRNPPRPLVEDLDTLPGLDYGLFDYPRYVRNHGMAGVFITARGCPYPCTYCINHASLELYKGLGKFVRYRSVDNAIAEIKRNVRTYGLRRVEIHDDTFTLDKSRVSEFCARYKKEVGVPFTINARVENLTSEMCSELAGGGCRRVLLGIESGDATIRREVLHRNTTDEQIFEGCAMVKTAGMELYTFNVIGVPQETEEHIQRTLEINRVVQPDALAVSLFTAYPGTQLYQQCRDNGWLDETRDFHSYFVSTNVKHPEISLRRLKRIRRLFGFRVFVKYDLKRALMELADRNLINFPYYSRIRSLILAGLIRRREYSAVPSAVKSH